MIAITDYDKEILLEQIRKEQARRRKAREDLRRYQRRIERAAISSALCVLAIGGLAWVALIRALEMAAC